MWREILTPKFQSPNKTWLGQIFSLLGRNNIAGCKIQTLWVDFLLFGQSINLKGYAFCYRNIQRRESKAALVNCMILYDIILKLNLQGDSVRKCCPWEMVSMQMQCVPERDETVIPYSHIKNPIWNSILPRHWNHRHFGLRFLSL